MTESTIDQDRMRKLKGLLATAESLAEQGNEEAANSYVQKAQELQAKWSIDDAMLADAGNTSRPQAIVSKVIKLPGAHGRRRVGLAHVVALRTDCTGYFGHTYQLITRTKDDGTTFQTSDYDAPRIYTYTVYGFENDVAWVEELTHSLMRQCDSELSIATRLKRSYENGRSFAVSFWAGFTSTIDNRLTVARRVAEKEAQEAARSAHMSNLQPGDAIQPPASVSLVLVGKREQVKKEMTARVGRLGKGSDLSTTSYSGYDAGRSAGSRATIARGSISGGSRSLSR